mmetsp:Transcript_89672/g.252802  ORF Transcript_89672/g.252802 Transcript_89672/m.252802 type:complete len:919 (+) Transcript_89672:171-2927(+)
MPWSSALAVAAKTTAAAAAGADASTPWTFTWPTPRLARGRSAAITPPSSFHAAVKALYIMSCEDILAERDAQKVPAGQCYVAAEGTVCEPGFVMVRDPSGGHAGEVLCQRVNPEHVPLAEPAAAQMYHHPERELVEAHGNEARWRPPQMTCSSVANVANAADAEAIKAVPPGECYAMERGETCAADFFEVQDATGKQWWHKFETVCQRRGSPDLPQSTCTTVKSIEDSREVPVGECHSKSEGKACESDFVEVKDAAGRHLCQRAPPQRTCGDNVASEDELDKVPVGECYKAPKRTSCARDFFEVPDTERKYPNEILCQRSASGWTSDSRRVPPPMTCNTVSHADARSTIPVGECYATAQGSACAKDFFEVRDTTGRHALETVCQKGPPKPVPKEADKVMNKTSEGQAAAGVRPAAHREGAVAAAIEAERRHVTDGDPRLPGSVESAITEARSRAVTGTLEELDSLHDQKDLGGIIGVPGCRPTKAEPPAKTCEVVHPARDKMEALPGECYKPEAHAKGEKTAKADVDANGGESATCDADLGFFKVIDPKRMDILCQRKGEDVPPARTCTKIHTEPGGEGGKSNTRHHMDLATVLPGECYVTGKEETCARPDFFEVRDLEGMHQDEVICQRKSFAPKVLAVKSEDDPNVRRLGVTVWKPLHSRDLGDLRREMVGAAAMAKCDPFGDPGYGCGYKGCCWNAHCAQDRSPVSCRSWCASFGSTGCCETQQSGLCRFVEGDTKFDPVGGGKVPEGVRAAICVKDPVPDAVADARKSLQMPHVAEAVAQVRAFDIVEAAEAKAAAGANAGGQVPRPVPAGMNISAGATGVPPAPQQGASPPAWLASPPPLPRLTPPPPPQLTPRLAPWPRRHSCRCRGHATAWRAPAGVWRAPSGTRWPAAAEPRERFRRGRAAAFFAGADVS